MGKRESEKELTDRNWDDEDESEEPQGEFARASEDVLKTRKIVKARRTVAAANVTVAPVVAPVILGGQLQFPTFGEEKKESAAAEEKKEEEKKEEKKEEEKKEEEKKEEETKKTEEPAKPAATTGFSWPPSGNWPFAAPSSSSAAPASTAAAAPAATTSGDAKPAFAGFQWPSLSTDKPADGAPKASPWTFPTFGAAATGGEAPKPFSFNSTPGAPFSFPVIPAAAKPAESGENEEDDKTEENPAAQIFRKEDAIVHLEEVDVVTGEEEEEKVHEVRGKLFKFADGKWVEKGLGMLRLNVAKPKEGEKPFARLLMRGDGAVGVVLNSPLFAAMACEKLQEKAVKFMAVESDNKPYLHSLRVRDSKEADTLVQKVKEQLAKLSS